jgi:hypothetical protein
MFYYYNISTYCIISRSIDNTNVFDLLYNILHTENNENVSYVQINVTVIMIITFSIN